MSATIPEAALRELANEWIGQGIAVAGPARVSPGRVQYVRLDDASRLLLDGYIRPSNSIKEFFFPRTETLYSYKFHPGGKVELVDAAAPDAKQIVLAARPCDAAAVPVLDHVFNWDYRDEFWFQRRENTTVVSLACNQFDASCFCTSVGLGPRAAKGSDAMLLDLGGGEYEVRRLTPKGEALFAGLTFSGGGKPREPEGAPAPFPLPAIDFDSPVFAQASLPCLGCGACAYTCPTCHCFDIVDEGNARGGARRKNWDTCQFPVFTLHASGHNPRRDQAQRQRQRIYHKFRIYPEKFGEILCTGCGNCSRNCPAGLGVQSVLRAL